MTQYFTLEGILLLKQTELNFLWICHTLMVITLSINLLKIWQYELKYKSSKEILLTRNPHLKLSWTQLLYTYWRRSKFSNSGKMWSWLVPLGSSSESSMKNHYHLLTHYKYYVHVLHEMLVWRAWSQSWHKHMKAALLEILPAADTSLRNSLK
jgi:hypothetical protein